MNNINDILNAFKPITLEEIKSADVGLMNRIDTKYLLTYPELLELLIEVKQAYCALEINNTRLHGYETLYFDTDDCDYYMMHHNKKGTRVKVRVRRYVINGLIFLEVKEKNNKQVTAKKRIAVPAFPERLSEIKDLIVSQGFNMRDEELYPQLWTVFERITLVNPVLKERLTIDLNLHIRNETCDILCKDMVVVELKREKSQGDSPILEWMKNLNIREQGFSKYTIGSALISDSLKKNNFKLKLAELKSKFEFDFQY